MKTISILIIWIVTAIDIYCCQWLTPETELNPVAREILIQYGVWHLVAWKVIGTYIATEWLRALPTYFCLIAAGGMLMLLGVLTGVFAL